MAALSGQGQGALDVEEERSRIERTYAEEVARVDQKMDAEHGRQKAQFQQRLAARKKLLLEKQEAALEREAPEVAALAAKLRQMEVEKEAELEAMAQQHAAQMAERMAAQEAEWSRKVEEQAAKEKKRKAKERRMLEQTVKVSDQHVSAATHL